MAAPVTNTLDKTLRFLGKLRFHPSLKRVHLLKGRHQISGRCLLRDSWHQRILIRYGDTAKCLRKVIVWRVCQWATLTQNCVPICSVSQLSHLSLTKLGCVGGAEAGQ